VGNTSSRPGSSHPMRASPASVSLIHRSHGPFFERGSLCQPEERAGQAVQRAANVTDGQLSRCTYDDYRKSIHLVADSDAPGIAPPGRLQRLTARRGNATGLPRLTLAPLSGYMRARPPGCLPDQVGRAAASRTGSGRLPPGAKREAARIAVDRSPDRPLADPSRLYRPRSSQP
jgi:hypothetical protein